MSFVAGFTAGLMAGKKKFGGSGGGGDELWTPPADWLEVPEPGPWEANFLIEINENNMTFQFLFADPRYSWSGKGTIIIDWGDGNTESFIGGEIGDDGSMTGDSWHELKHTYSSDGQYVIKVTTDKFTCLLQYFPSEKINYNYSSSSKSALRIAKLGENIRLETDGTTGYKNGNGSFFFCCGLCWVSIKGNSTLPEYCFQGCHSLKRVDFSGKITEVPYYCFYDCWQLNFSQIVFSEITKIDTYGIQNCYNIAKAYLPKCREIGINAFNYSSGLFEITAPLCTSVGNGAFSGCRSLKKATFAENCTFGTNAFQNCYNLYPRPDGSTN